VVVPNFMPVSMHISAFACACFSLFSGLSNRFFASKLAFSLASGFEKYFNVIFLARSRTSGFDTYAVTFSLMRFFKSGFEKTLRIVSECFFLNSGFANRCFAFLLKFSRNSLEFLRVLCFCLVSSDTKQPEAPSPPRVLLHNLSLLYFSIKEISSSKASFSVNPFFTISMV